MRQLVSEFLTSIGGTVADSPTGSALLCSFIDSRGYTFYVKYWTSDERSFIGLDVNPEDLYPQVLIRGQLVQSASDIEALLANCSTFTDAFDCTLGSIDQLRRARVA